MTFRPLPADWPRRETYAHYRRHPCSYSVTQTVDVTALRRRGVPFAPALIHAICRTVNRLPALRMTEQGGEIGYWEEVWPAYTVFYGFRLIPAQSGKRRLCIH
uniref:CatA-like O-acetyltransferase n=1 Tax=Deinococcus wulumuqiensis TaxID=980427 RepID=UPI00242EB9D7